MKISGAGILFYKKAMKKSVVIRNKGEFLFSVSFKSVTVE
jgi:hypothetical protein